MAECDDELDCSAPTQVIRLVDVFFLGPAMIWLGTRQRNAVGAFVTFAGLATIAFNGERFVRASKRAAED